MTQQSTQGRQASAQRQTPSGPGTEKGRPNATRQGPGARVGVMGPDLVRLLGRLMEVRVPPAPSRTAFADSLAAWTGWTDAIALSAALDRADGAAGQADSSPPETGACAALQDSARTELAALRERLIGIMDCELARTARSPLDVEQGYSPFRLCLLAQQQAMGTAVARHRERVRRLLASIGPDQARLAALDAALMPVLGVQERRLFGRVPPMLERRYQRLRESAVADLDAEGAGGASGSDGSDPMGATGAMMAGGQPASAPAPADTRWLEQFREEFRAVLHAELALRLQPIEGLIAALQIVHQLPSHQVES